MLRCLYQMMLERTLSLLGVIRAHSHFAPYQRFRKINKYPGYFRLMKKLLVSSAHWLIASTHSDSFFSASFPADLSQTRWQISFRLPLGIQRASVANLSPRVLKIPEEC